MIFAPTEAVFLSQHRWLLYGQGMDQLPEDQSLAFAKAIGEAIAPYLSRLERLEAEVVILNAVVGVLTEEASIETRNAMALRIEEYTQTGGEGRSELVKLALQTLGPEIAQKLRQTPKSE